jgi:nucleotidyltransferase/DNA polymerase involved in DNA repair
MTCTACTACDPLTFMGWSVHACARTHAPVSQITELNGLGGKKGEELKRTHGDLEFVADLQRFSRDQLAQEFSQTSFVGWIYDACRGVCHKPVERRLWVLFAVLCSCVGALGALWPLRQTGKASSSPRENVWGDGVDEKVA